MPSIHRLHRFVGQRAGIALLLLAIAAPLHAQAPTKAPTEAPAPSGSLIYTLQVDPAAAARSPVYAERMAVRWNDSLLMAAMRLTNGDSATYIRHLPRQQQWVLLDKADGQRLAMLDRDPPLQTVRATPGKDSVAILPGYRALPMHVEQGLGALRATAWLNPKLPPSLHRATQTYMDLPAGPLRLDLMSAEGQRIMRLDAESLQLNTPQAIPWGPQPGYRLVGEPNPGE